MFKLMKHLRNYRKEVIIGPLLKFLEVICELALPTIMALAINNGVIMQDKSYVLKMGGLMVILAFAGFACAWVCQRVASYTSQGFGTMLRDKLFSHIMSLSPGQVRDMGASTLTNRLTNDVNQMQLWVAMMIRLVSRSPFIIIGSLIMAFSLDVRLALILLAATPFLGLIIYLLTRFTSPLYRSYQSRLDILGRRVKENLSGVRVIRAFSKEDYEEKRFASDNNGVRDTGLGIGRLSALYSPLTSLVVNLVILTILWQGGIHIEGGTLSQGDLIAFISYVNQILVALLVLANLIILFTRSLAAAGRINHVFDITPDIIENPRFPETPAIAGEAVGFSHVRFGYNMTGEPVLDNADFTIPRGKVVGIIGATGSGKSTIAALILRFFDVMEGSVRVDGRDVKDYPLTVLREKIGFVPQKTKLFSGTIADNIRWGNPGAPDEQVRHAATLAQAHDFIMEMPAGYDSPVSRDGRNLSGGQKQRIAVARALIRQPDILILDDATSALDFRTEALVRTAIRRDAPDRTMFIISQRAGIVKDADIIIVCDNGRIAGIGSHASLHESCGVYRNICMSQLTGQEAAS
ncbi:ABC transporter ATP-binding protein [Parasphaerochaeta coccoides]|uniref:Xenobiotic-transporting ATPase n=1 Tax=Parasphaerochaeta coccoides (strain ATCC BAA-1237 / DSM 17374 / SPN1) TaxID=760011 RepID=F4GJY5_PARC1|nr:ABC transporter ATP-binding protein [Parasphaerochaeta coccoides]AEC01410.1 Xenobiotic-transporting ATPase [Parasphaerochaeta coccoides DSM 17374]